MLENRYPSFEMKYPFFQCESYYRSDIIQALVWYGYLHVVDCITWGAGFSDENGYSLCTV